MPSYARLPLVAIVLVAAMTACNPPFPAPPQTLPDCEFGPSTEFCGARKESVKHPAPYIIGVDQQSWATVSLTTGLRTEDGGPLRTQDQLQLLIGD